jgi:hypothetical protein
MASQMTAYHPLGQSIWEPGPAPEYPALQRFVKQHGAALRALLPDYMWPLNPYKVEQFGPLTKYTLSPLPDGRWAMLHHVTEVDTGPPHDHPTEMETHLFNPYLEVVYLGDGRTEEVLHPAGSSFVIAPERIHRLAGLPDGEAWTLVKAGPVVRKWRHYPELA